MICAMRNYLADDISRSFAFVDVAAWVGCRNRAHVFTVPAAFQNVC